MSDENPLKIYKEKLAELAKKVAAEKEKEDAAYQQFLQEQMLSPQEDDVYEGNVDELTSEERKRKQRFKNKQALAEKGDDTSSGALGDKKNKEKGGKLNPKRIKDNAKGKDLGNQKDAMTIPSDTPLPNKQIAANNLFYLAIGAGIFLVLLQYSS